MNFARTLLGVAFLTVGPGATAQADWPRSPFQCVSIGADPPGFVAFYGSLDVKAMPIAADGFGGLIAAWPKGTFDQSRLQVQRIDSAAGFKWGASTTITGASSAQRDPVVIADGVGGAFIAWADWRESTGPDLYAQHVDANGASLWSPSGVPICRVAEPQRSPVASLDREGGLLVAWEDSRDQGHGSGQDVYLQRLNADGVPLWGLNGLAVATGPSDQVMPQLLPTGDGGTYTAWGIGYSGGARLQRYDRDGITVWQSPAAANGGTLSTLLPDGHGGAIIGLSSGMLQRVDSAGAVRIGGSGVRVAPENAYLAAGVEDESGGSYWLYRTVDRNYHVTHLDGVGESVWADPVTVGTGFVDFEAVMIGDGQGGVINHLARHPELGPATGLREQIGLSGP